jgi:outer membrane protein assembly factor BamB
MNKYTRYAAVMLLAVLALGAAHAEDWPTYRHDNRRSGVTAETLDAGNLTQAWVHTPAYPPQPAWSGPAKWDAYAGIVGLRSMRNYDPVFHAVVADGAVYFGSSAEDCVVSLDAATGEERWSFVVGGPVRIAPAYADGNLYFGSDDGYAYCVRADDSGLVWKYSPAPEQRLIPNDGKMIPLWPIRTGVLVDDGKAYFGAALLPWEPAYLCAVNAATGSPEGPGLYCRTMDHVTMEGAILASPAKLYMPQGRSAPMVFNRENGDHLGDLEGGGGVFAVLTPDLQIAHGPGNKKGWITLSNADTRDKIATVSLGNAMVVTETRSFVLKDTELLALDRASGDTLWRTETNHPYTLILAGEALFAGGENAVAAFDTTDGRCLATLSVSGRAHGLAVAGGGLFVSTDTGAIHCFR